MSRRGASGPTPEQPSGALVTAHATGVLVLALRVTPEAAHHALVMAARRNQVAVEALAAAVVAEACGATGGDQWLRRMVRSEWGDLLD